MSAITERHLPDDALLRLLTVEGSYTDCFAVELPGVISLPQYIEVFYTGAVFKLERLILRLVVAKPSSDAQARQLAQGTTDAFAAWTVQARNAQQLLMVDYLGQTRSWLMVEPMGTSDGGAGTRLYFGSAVRPTPASVAAGRPRMGLSFRLLLGFHRLYSRVLLGAAARGLQGPGSSAA